MLTTRAAVVEAPGAPFTVHDVELDDVRPGEVLVEMVAAGLCHTDLGVQHGGVPFALPGILGHEGAGIVLQVGTRAGRSSRSSSSNAGVGQGRPLGLRDNASTRRSASGSR
jgi:aryl-alcohol dehydrogenase